MKWLKWLKRLLNWLHLGKSKTKVAYICGALTELPIEVQIPTKRFYSRLGDVCGNVLGHRAFVPHEHYDPIANASFTPQEVFDAESLQIEENTNFLIIVAIAPSWGGGIEAFMAKTKKVPIILLIPAGRKVSRLLRGLPNIYTMIEYTNEDDACEQLIYVLHHAVACVPYD
jgi:hypothetical protein